MCERLNVNVSLCEHCDESMQNIQNIFNVVTVDIDKKVSFYVVTFLNGINIEYKKLRFLYYIQKIDIENPKRRYLYSMTLTREDRPERDDRIVKHSMESHVLYETTKYHAKDISFPDSGEYEIAVYMYKDDEIQELEGKTMRELAVSEKLIALRGFVVKE